MARGDGEHSSANDETLFLVAIVGIPLAIFAFWYFVGRYVYAAERTLLYGILSLWGSIPTDLPILGALTRKFLYFRYSNAKDMEFKADVVPDSLWVNGLIFLAVLIIVMRQVLYISKKHPCAKFGKRTSLYDYVEQQMPLYPHLRVMWKLRLLARPLRDGLFRLGDSAKEFSIRNGLVSLASLTADPALNEQKAKRVLESQLGVLMPMPTDDHATDAKTLVKRLNVRQKAILAAVLPRLAACDSKVSDAEFKAAIAKSNALEKQYWEGFDAYNPEPPPDDDGSATINLDMPLVPPPPPVNASGCDEVILKYCQFPMVREGMRKHAYVTTFIYDSLQACRKVGKFPPSRFRWLKMNDRALWLMVDSAGRATPYWEAAGVHAHYLWERKSGNASEKPQVREAVAALSQENDGVLFTKDQKDRIWQLQAAKPVILQSKTAVLPRAVAPARVGPRK